MALRPFGTPLTSGVVGVDGEVLLEAAGYENLTVANPYGPKYLLYHWVKFYQTPVAVKFCSIY